MNQEQQQDRLLIDDHDHVFPEVTDERSQRLDCVEIYRYRYSYVPGYLDMGWKSEMALFNLRKKCSQNPVES